MLVNTPPAGSNTVASVCVFARHAGASELHRIRHHPYRIPVYLVGGKQGDIWISTSMSPVHVSSFAARIDQPAERRSADPLK
jgi:alkanesulfonate monooxygenase SsuD/methylene tetrahydromethanopterin reductase-like flavin-dependent oxidoreductase (luciferase family)